MRRPYRPAATAAARCLCPIVTAIILLAATPPGAPARAIAPIDGFWTARASAMTTATGWALRGVALAHDGALTLEPSPAPLSCARDDIDGGATRYDAEDRLCAGQDPYAPGAYGGRNYYNGGRFHDGVALSPPLAAASFDRAIASWVARTPPGTWLEVHLRVRLETGIWTRWYAMPIWASGLETIRRHSIDGQGGAATVETDTLALRPGRSATAYQLGVTLFTAGTNSPRLRRLSLALSDGAAAMPTGAPASSAAWGRDLAVPPRSQMLPSYRNSAYGGGGEVWCSPTSTSMLLAYWAHLLGRPDLVESVPLAARGAYDWTYTGTGDWPFNVAHATSFDGLDGYVARFPSLSTLEPWIAAGVPLALSIAFAPATLPGAPIASSNGHLLVLRGFDRAGNPIVNDPAAPTDATVRRIYPRAALERAWLRGSNGTTYILYPPNWPIPPM